MVIVAYHCGMGGARVVIIGCKYWKSVSEFMEEDKHRSPPIVLSLIMTNLYWIVSLCIISVYLLGCQFTWTLMSAYHADLGT